MARLLLFHTRAAMLPPIGRGVEVSRAGRGLRAALLAAAVGLVSLLPLACGGGGSAGGERSAAARGGVFRVGTADFGFSNGFDPTGEYTSWAWSLYGNLLTRSLVGYRHVEGAPGTELVADLSSAIPAPSDDGLTWRFTLRPGVMFGPPVNRPVTSKDVAYAFERIGTGSLAAQYGFYYSDIVGMDAFQKGTAKTISGIRTPDDRTIVFTTTKPVPDFLYRLAMPATAPVPPEVGRCFTQAGEYGRYLISSGPYMIKGSAGLDISSCGAMTPISGFSPTRELALVRNPAYDPATDTAEARENLPDGFDVTLNTNISDMYQKVERGELEDVVNSVPSAIVARASRDSTLEGRLRSPLADAVNYFYMNLAQPPFDDVHVRRAVNWVMDKDALRRAFGGPLSGAFAGHIVPPDVYGRDPSIVDYDPYATPGSTGSVEKARAEMRQSRYDTDGDGICDAGPCRGVITVGLSSGPALTPVIRDSLAKIGIAITARDVTQGTAAGLSGDVSRGVPLGTWPGWSKDFPDAGGFMVLFDGRQILPSGNTNYSLVGLTRARAQTLGIPYPAGGVPSVDADIDRCFAAGGAERRACWIALDKKLTEQVVPWVPWTFPNDTHLLGPAVTQWQYDQFAAETAYAHVAVDPRKQH